MGNLLRCCCPEDDSSSTSGGGGGDAYRSSETTPLLRDGGGGGHHAGRSGGADQMSVGSGVDSAGRRISCQQDLQPRVGFEGRVASPQDHVVANEELQKLNEILLEAANQIIDCSAAAAAGRSSSANAQAMLASTGTQGSSHSGGQLDPAEVQERAAMYARRVSAAAKTLAAKHLKPAPIYQGLVDVGSQMEKMHGQLANEVLSEADHVLATELCSRAQETIAESDEFEGDDEEVIVPFGKKRNTD